MRVVNVSKSYGEKKVFSHLSLSLAEGKTTIIRGRSGSGKTTLMNLILSLEKPDEGDIITEGRVSALFQEDRLIESLSALNNLLLVTDDKEKARAMLKETGLSEEERSAASSLSGGMRRRLSLARSLLTEYDALILDEPFTGLDDKSKERIAELIRKSVNGRTLLVITHDDEDYNLLSADASIDLDSLKC